MIRADLPHGVQVAQVAHAASEASGHPPTIVVALAVADEAELRRLADLLGDRALAHTLIVEDAGPHAGEATAIGIHPTTDRAAIRKATSALALVK